MANIINIIFVYLLVLFRYLIFFKFAKETSKLKDVKKSAKIICETALILTYCISSYFFGKMSIYYLPVIFELILYFIYLKIIYKNNFKEDIILAFTCCITFEAFNDMVYLSMMQLDKYIKLPWFISEYVPGILSIIVVYFFMTKVTLRFMNFKKCELRVTDFLFLLFFCLTSFMSLSIFYDNPFVIGGGIICWAAVVGLCYDYKLLDEKERAELAVAKRNDMLEEQDRLLKESIEEKYKSFQKSKEAESEIRRINHDLNHHFDFLLSCDTAEKMKDYINRLKGKNNVINKFFDTGDAVVDIVLGDMANKAEAAGVKLEVIGGFEEPLGIEPSDVSVILGNLVDNAIEGASKVKDNYKKVIVNFYQGPNEESGIMEFYLKVQNTLDVGVLKVSPNGTIETTKEDKDSHGIGLKSVKKIVQSYGGTMNIDVRPERFIVELHIPFKR